MNESLVLGNRNPFSQFLILIGIVFLSASVFSFLPFLLAKPFFGIDALNNPSLFDQTSNPQTVSFLKFIQVMQSLGFFVFPPLLFSFLYYRNLKDFLSLNLNFKFVVALAMLAIMLSALPAINWLGELNGKLKLPAELQGIESWMKTMEAEAERLTKAFLVMNSLSSFFLNLFIVAIIPAIGEELLFRGALQSILSKMTNNKHLGIWISAVLFSALHMQFYGFFPRMLLGALFGYTLLWTGSLWIPILGHFVNNGTAILISYLEQRGIVNAQLETIGAQSESNLLVMGSFISVGILLFWLRKKSMIAVQVPAL